MRYASRHHHRQQGKTHRANFFHDRDISSRIGAAHWRIVTFHRKPAMRQMPRFIKIGPTLNTDPSSAGNVHLDDYKPLLALWLIDMALSRHWITEPPSGSLRITFVNVDFMGITGMYKLAVLLRGEDDENDEDEADLASDTPLRQRTRSAGKTRPKRDSQSVLRQKLHKLFTNRRAELMLQDVRPDLPLFQNIDRLGRMVNLNETEQAVLTFAACMNCFTGFRNALASQFIPLSDPALISMLATLTGQPGDLVRKAIHRNSVLTTSGLIRIDHDELVDLDEKITLVRDLQGGLMLVEMNSDDELSRRVLHPAKPGTLTLADFPHLAKDAELITDYLAGVSQTQYQGANVLLYGPPGTGKTEFAKALAAQCGLHLYDIGHADEDGDPLSGEQRLHSLNFCQRTLKGKSQAALLFDEVEDVLPGQSSGSLLAMLLTGKPVSKGGKAWINRALEENPVPTLWITNNVNIDPAYLRRFDYSVAMRIPPRQVRLRIAAGHLSPHAPNSAALVPIAELDDLLPAQLERAARVARLCALANPELAWQYSGQTLQRSRALLGQSRKNLKATQHTQYNLALLNTDADIPAILCALRVSPIASMCLYGPSGTGKSQLARHIADELDKPILIKRASDLLDMYVGGTEQRIAEMFEQALDEDAVLLLDEADSFLMARSGAAQRWELTQTNEMLTQLECFEGIFMATTNLMAQFESASLRRFSHKISFDFLKPGQRWEMFVQEFSRLGGVLSEAQTVADQVRRIENLAPGDFAVVGKNRAGLNERLTAAEFLRLLEHEAAVKLHGKGRVGFV
jgi:SpoVK/Ycf46/Vps4 family AAA+-type ATPase